jgi:hypothetical protein
MTRKLRFPVRSYEQALDIYQDVSAARRGALHPLAVVADQSSHPQTSIRRYKMDDASLYRKMRVWRWAGVRQSNAMGVHYADRSDMQARANVFVARRNWPGIYVSQLPAELNATTVDDAYVREGLIPNGRIAFSYTFGSLRVMRDVVVWRPDGSCVISRSSGLQFECGLRKAANCFSPVQVWRERGQAFFSFQDAWGSPNRDRRFALQCGRQGFHQPNVSVVLPADKRRKPYDLVSGETLITRGEQITANKHARARADHVRKLVRIAMGDPLLAEQLRRELQRTVNDVELAMSQSLGLLSGQHRCGVLDGADQVGRQASNTSGAPPKEHTRAIVFKE